MKTQNTQILNYLREGYAITPMEALNQFGCFRLGARIYDLKRQGHPIQSVRVTSNGKTFSQYFLPENLWRPKSLLAHLDKLCDGILK
jgi:hypothetical protein